MSRQAKLKQLHKIWLSKCQLSSQYLQQLEAKLQLEIEKLNMLCDYQAQIGVHEQIIAAVKLKQHKRLSMKMYTAIQEQQKNCDYFQQQKQKHAKVYLQQKKQCEKVEMMIKEYIVDEQRHADKKASDQGMITHNYMRKAQE